MELCLDTTKILSTSRSNGLNTLAQQSLAGQTVNIPLLILEVTGIESIHGQLLEEDILLSGEVILLLEHGILFVDGSVVGSIGLKVVVIAKVSIVHGVIHQQLRVPREVVGEAVRVVHETTLQKSLLLLLSSELLVAHPLLVLEQDLLHLGGALSEGLGGLLAGAIVADFEPEAELLVFLEEPSVHFANGTNDGARDGGLVILAGLEVGAAVGVDEITEATVARVDVGASTTTAEDVVARVELDAGLGRLDGGALVEGGACGIVGNALFGELVSAVHLSVVHLRHHLVAVGHLGLVGECAEHVSVAVGVVHVVRSHNVVGLRKGRHRLQILERVFDGKAHLAVAKPRQVAELTAIVFIGLLAEVAVHEVVEMIHCRREDRGGKREW